MKTKLFNEDTESYSIEGSHIGNEFDAAILAVFNKYSDKYFVRELEVIAFSSVSMAACKAVMDQQRKFNEARKAEIAANVSDPNLVDKVRKQATLLSNGFQNTFIVAIKALRSLTGMGLKEAKDWVETNMSEFHPSVHEE